MIWSLNHFVDIEEGMKYLMGHWQPFEFTVGKYLSKLFCEVLELTQAPEIIEVKKSAAQEVLSQTLSVVKA